MPVAGSQQTNSHLSWCCQDVVVFNFSGMSCLSEVSAYPSVQTRRWTCVWRQQKPSFNKEGAAQRGQMSLQPSSGWGSVNNTGDFGLGGATSWQSIMTVTKWPCCRLLCLCPPSLLPSWLHPFPLLCSFLSPLFLFSLSFRSSLFLSHSLGFSSSLDLLRPLVHVFILVSCPLTRKLLPLQQQVDSWWWGWQRCIAIARGLKFTGDVASQSHLLHWHLLSFPLLLFLFLSLDSSCLLSFALLFLWLQPFPFSSLFCLLSFSYSPSCHSASLS